MTLPTDTKKSGLRYGLPFHLSLITCGLPNMTLTFSPSKKAKAESSMTLNSYLYGTPDVVECLTQGERTTVETYRNRAAGHITEFERAFARNEAERTRS